MAQQKLNRNIKTEILKRKKLRNHIAICSVRYNTESFPSLMAEAPARGYKLHRHSFPRGAQGKILTIPTKAKIVKKSVFQYLKSSNHTREDFCTYLVGLEFYLQTRGRIE